MTAFIFKENGLWKSLTEDGWLLHVCDFHANKTAIEVIGGWLEADGYMAEYVEKFWNDQRILQAKAAYQANHQIPWEGKFRNATA